MIIIIKNDFKSDYTTREAGEKLRRMILENQGEIQIDFEGVKVASASFFDESFAKLYLENGQQNWTDRVQLINLNKFDQKLFDQVCSARS